jgi:hypothetical protein
MNMQTRTIAAFLAAALLLAAPVVFAQDALPDSGNQDEAALAELAAQVAELQNKLATVDRLQKEVQDLRKRVDGKQDALRASLSMTAETSWSVNLRTGRTGFDRLGASSMEITFVPKGSSREEPRRIREFPASYIKLKDYSLSVQDSGLVTNPGSIEAKIYLTNQVWTRVYGSVNFLLDSATPIDQDDRSVETNASTNGAGIAVGYSNKLLYAELKLASAENANKNAANNYALGAFTTWRLIDKVLDVDVGATLGMDLGNPVEELPWAPRDVGFTVKPVFTLPNLVYGSSLSLGADGFWQYDELMGDYQPFAWDAKLDFLVKVSPKAIIDSTDAWSIATVSAYLDDDLNLDLAFGFNELKGNYGLLPVIGMNANLELLNLLSSSSGGTADSLKWKISGRMGVTAGPVEFYASSGYGTSGIVPLSLGFTADPLPMTSFDIGYVSRNINHPADHPDTPGDRGMIQFKTRITYK